MTGFFSPPGARAAPVGQPYYAYVKAFFVYRYRVAGAGCLYLATASEAQGRKNKK